MRVDWGFEQPEMTMMKSSIGSIEWRDLTVSDAESIKRFYQDVVGWRADPVSMGEYNDFNMTTADSDEPVAGICHARGDNADQPAQWMMYVRVADISASVATVKQLGGSLLRGPSEYAGDQYYVIKDPAGAVITLYGATQS